MANGDIGKDNLIGAYCHVPIIGGLLVPLIVYFWKGKENKELGFQAKQALVYQIIVSIIAVVGLIVIGALSFAMFYLGEISGLLSMVLWLIYAVLMLAFFILAIMAAWRTYNKVSYEYPVIGKRLR